MPLAADTLNDTKCLDAEFDDVPNSVRQIELQANGLCKSFGSNPVLRGVDITIRKGEIVAIVGGSGCGKTVLLKMMVGNLRPDSGSLAVADHSQSSSPLVDIQSLSDRELDAVRSYWGVVFQRNALLSGTVQENLSLALECVQGLGSDEIRRRCQESIRSVGLSPELLLPMKRDDLSGGMAKRVAIARALAIHPLVLFYDEPTTGLDPKHAELIHNLIKDQCEQTNGDRTIVIVTHDKDLLYRLQPRVVMLNEGVVFFDGPYSVFRQSTWPIIRPYFELMPRLNQRSFMP